MRHDAACSSRRTHTLLTRNRPAIDIIRANHLQRRAPIQEGIPLRLPYSRLFSPHGQSLRDNGITLSNDAVCHPPSHITTMWVADSLGTVERQCPGSMEDRLRDRPCHEHSQLRHQRTRPVSLCAPIAPANFDS